MLRYTLVYVSKISVIVYSDLPWDKIKTYAGQLETQEATAKIQELSKKTDLLKLQVYDATIQQNTDSLFNLHTTEQLVSDVQGTKAEMEEVEDKIQNKVHMYIVFLQEFYSGIKNSTHLLMLTSLFGRMRSKIKKFARPTVSGWIEIT